MILLFDLDDTLYPEKTYIYQGFFAVAKFLSMKTKSDTIKTYLDLIKIFRMGSKKVFDDLLNEYRLDIEPFSLINVYREAERKLYYYPEVPSALNYIRSLQIKLILLTNGDSETQRKKIKILGIEKYFDDIFVLDDFGKEYWKPSILILDNIYNRYGKHDKYVMIGNANEDLEFAMQAKIDFVFIDRKNSVRKIEDTYTGKGIKNLNELIPMIEKRLI